VAFRQASDIRNFYKTRVTKTAGEIADFWCKRDPFLGVLPEHHDSIRAATLLITREGARPTFQTLCCFMHDLKLSNSKEILELSINSLAKGDWSIGGLEGFGEYKKKIVSCQAIGVNCFVRFTAEGLGVSRN